MKSTRTKRRRVGGALAVALCALTLTACGTEGAGARPEAAAVAATTPPPPARTATPTAAATPTAPATDPADDPNLTPEQQAAEMAFMELLVEVAGPCLGDPAEPPATEPATEPPASLQVPPGAPGPGPSEVPVDDTAQPTGQPWSFERARQETELSEGEKCAAPRHGRRIAKVLDGTGDATPAHVEKALRDLGYRVEYRVNGPREKNGKVGFTLDLRFMGDLCLTGEYDGSRTTYDAYGASPEVRCTDVKRREK